MLDFQAVDDELRAIAREWASDVRAQLLLSLVKVRLHNLWRASENTVVRRVNQRGAVRELHDDIKHLTTVLEKDDDRN